MRGGGPTPWARAQVGLSCDFGLHIAEGYAHSPLVTRRDRALDCIDRMGTAICSAAGTTVLGVVPMVFCTLQILVKFGMIVPIRYPTTM
jgi:predicted RND superfamily exporter protein